jgi:hypothetical protein
MMSMGGLHKNANEAVFSQRFGRKSPALPSLSGINKPTRIETHCGDTDICCPRCRELFPVTVVQMMVQGQSISLPGSTASDDEDDTDDEDAGMQKLVGVIDDSDYSDDDSDDAMPIFPVVPNNNRPPAGPRTVAVCLVAGRHGDTVSPASGPACEDSLDRTEAHGGAKQIEQPGSRCRGNNSPIPLLEQAMRTSAHMAPRSRQLVHQHMCPRPDTKPNKESSIDDTAPRVERVVNSGSYWAVARGGAGGGAEEEGDCVVFVHGFRDQGSSNITTAVVSYIWTQQDVSSVYQVQ